MNTPDAEIVHDYERALLFLVAAQVGLPDEGEKTVSLLAKIAGWDAARSKAALDEAVNRGLAEMVPVSDGGAMGDLERN